jgi:hypothetical protein
VRGSARNMLYYFCSDSWFGQKHKWQRRITQDEHLNASNSYVSCDIVLVRNEEEDLAAHDIPNIPSSTWLAPI